MIRKSPEAKANALLRCIGEVKSFMEHTLVL